MYYLDLDDEKWMFRFTQRNYAVAAGRELTYPMDENHLARFNAQFELPSTEELDVCISDRG